MFSALRLFVRAPFLRQIALDHHSYRRFFSVSSHRYQKPLSNPHQWMSDYIIRAEWFENLHKYECGLSFAVHLGDVLGGGRYKVLHKLGFGSFSNIWLAKDQFPGGHGYVALKIVPANTTEVKILKHLAQCPHDHPGSNHVIKLRDHFVIETTNGSFDGLVLELVGRCIFDEFGNQSLGKLSQTTAQQASVQAAMGLAYMHEMKICHGDLHANNVCFAALNVNDLSEAQIMDQLGPPVTLDIERSDGKAIPPSVPRYTVRPSSFNRMGDVFKIVDLGQAFFFDQKPERISTPIYLRAPELLFSTNSLGWDYRIDLWSLGCLLYEFFTGQCAFENAYPHTLGYEMFVKIGEVPQCWQSQFNSKELFNPDGSLVEAYEYLRPLEEDLRESYDFSGGDMTRKELEHLAALLRELLVVEPRNRKSASQIADHPWLRGS